MKKKMGRYFIAAGLFMISGALCLQIFTTADRNVNLLHFGKGFLVGMGLVFISAYAVVMIKAARKA